MKIMNCRKKLSLIILSLLLSSTNVLGQNENENENQNQGNGFFVEGAQLTLVQASTLRDDGFILVNYLGGCSGCETSLRYNDDTQIFAGVNAVKLRSSEINGLQAAAGSIFVDENNYIYKIRLFEVPRSF